MTNQDVTNLKIARNFILEIISLAQTTSTELLFQKVIKEAEFKKIFEEVEIPLCRIADQLAVAINQELLTPVTSYQQEIESVCNQVKSTLKNLENPDRLISAFHELVNFFDNIASNKNLYPETSKILSEIKDICNQY
jgi:hypothetical protein